MMVRHLKAAAGLIIPKLDKDVANERGNAILKEI